MIPEVRKGFHLQLNSKNTEKKVEVLLKNFSGGLPVNEGLHVSGGVRSHVHSVHRNHGLGA